jgi:ferric iron reductase protein FhuF
MNRLSGPKRAIQKSYNLFDVKKKEEGKLEKIVYHVKLSKGQFTQEERSNIYFSKALNKMSLNFYKSKN